MPCILSQSNRIRPPRIGAEIHGSDRPARVKSMPLMQPLDPKYFTVTDDSGCDILIRPSGKGWMFVSRAGEAEKMTVARVPRAKAAPKLQTAQPRKAHPIQPSSPVAEVSTEEAHRLLDEARLRYDKARDEGRKPEVVTEAFEHYTRLIADVNRLHPAFYEGILA